MGLLNHIFENKKNTAEELIINDNKRVALWDEHLTNYTKREKLSKNFNFRNIDQALQDFDRTNEILGQIESLISPELINIGDDEKTEKEILIYLKKIKNNAEIEELSNEVLQVKQKQSTLLELFHEILNVLRVELHLIRLIRKKPSNSRDLLLNLFEIIFHREARLYKVFIEQYFFEENKHIHQNIVRIARAILLEEEIKEEIETDEEKFAREMVKQMAPDESKRRYRRLGEDIFLELAEMAGAPMSKGEDVIKGMEDMEEFMKDDKTMYKIVKKLRPKYDDAKLKIVILAFRQAYNLGHFEELESEFIT